MIIGKNFFIIEIPKTGTSFLRNYFKKYKNIIITTHHDTVEHNPKLNLLKKKYRISVIRSPYLWYLSFWKWSCLKKNMSPLYKDLTSQRLKIKRLKFNSNIFRYIASQITKDTSELKKLFSDINSKKNFNRVLEILLNSKYKNLIGSDFSFMPQERLGYMTHYFFYQNVLRKHYNILFKSDLNFSKTIKKLDSKIFTNYHFKTESLNDDLKIFLKKSRIKEKKIKNIDKNESSNEKKNNFIKFFSKKNLLLIEKKENYIFKKFKYKKLSNNNFSKNK